MNECENVFQRVIRYKKSFTVSDEPQSHESLVLFQTDCILEIIDSQLEPRANVDIEHSEASDTPERLRERIKTVYDSLCLAKNIYCDSIGF